MAQRLSGHSVEQLSPENLGDLERSAPQESGKNAGAGESGLAEPSESLDREDRKDQTEATEHGAAPETKTGSNVALTPVIHASEKRKQGKQLGYPGYGRTWSPPINDTVHCKSPCCAACGLEFDQNTRHTAYTAYDTVDVRYGMPDSPGISVHGTRTCLYV